MGNISVEIGKNINKFRKKRGFTIVKLAEKLGKSKATISKYERGEIIVDIETLYKIANILDMSIEQLLVSTSRQDLVLNNEISPTFFEGISQFYAYVFDGRSNKLIRCVFDILNEISKNKYKVIMYMNFKTFEDYHICENTYCGVIEHYDTLTNILLENQDTSLEKVNISILASFLNSDTKWGLFFGISSRPMMPVATKMLFSKKKLKEDNLLIEKLKINKEDIRLLKIYNMFSAI